MPIHLRKLLKAFCTTVFVSAVACSTDRTTAPTPSPLPPLTAATWQVHAANGNALPALVHQRLVNGALLQTFLDSAQVIVANSGRWEQRTWLRRYRDGLFDTTIAEQDGGTWTIGADAVSYTHLTLPTSDLV